MKFRSNNRYLPGAERNFFFVVIAGVSVFGIAWPGNCCFKEVYF